WTIPAAGGPGTLVVEGQGTGWPDWQPVVPKLSVVIDDGHEHPLRGLRVELRTPGGDVVNARPATPQDGVYVFGDAGPGTWVIRATLLDADHAPDDTPVFDVRHA